VHPTSPRRRNTSATRNGNSRADGSTRNRGSPDLGGRRRHRGRHAVRRTRRASSPARQRTRDRESTAGRAAPLAATPPGRAARRKASSYRASRVQLAERPAGVAASKAKGSEVEGQGSGGGAAYPRRRRRRRRRRRTRGEGRRGPGSSDGGEGDGRGGAAPGFVSAWGLGAGADLGKYGVAWRGVGWGLGACRFWLPVTARSHGTDADGRGNLPAGSGRWLRSSAAHMPGSGRVGPGLVARRSSSGRGERRAPSAPI
jgi:hypothetical protein